MAKYAVNYTGGGKWQVTDQHGTYVGMLTQGITQAWTARTADGQLRLIKTEREYGGPEHPYKIANTMVIW